ncbi:flagellar basal body P-ring formation chaperone FlgA [Burkholderiaceae bacterium UC74_6]
MSKLRTLAVLLLSLPIQLLMAGGAAAQSPSPQGALDEQVRQLASTAAKAQQHGARIEVEVGQLNPRLRLAACATVEPYLPPGLPMWGRTRIGLRCASGPVRWNVSLPVTVHVYARALVAAQPLPAGTVLAAEHLKVAEIDLAGEPGSPFLEADAPIGRSLARPLGAGETVRATALHKRQWFAAGEVVAVSAGGSGFRIDVSGTALSPGIEGQDVRIRLENGRTVTGRAVGERQVEVLL